MVSVAVLSFYETFMCVFAVYWGISRMEVLLTLLFGGNLHLKPSVFPLTPLWIEISLNVTHQPPSEDK